MWEYVNEDVKQTVQTGSNILHEAVICEQILTESISDAYIVEGDELLEGLDLYINQLESDKVDSELEEALSELIEPYFEMTLPLYEATISKAEFDSGITKAQDYARSANKKGVRSGKSLKQIEGEKAASSSGAGQTVKNDYKTPEFKKSKVLLGKLKEKFGHSKLAAILRGAKEKVASIKPVTLNKLKNTKKSIGAALIRNAAKANRESFGKTSRTAKAIRKVAGKARSIGKKMS